MKLLTGSDRRTGARRFGLVLSRSLKAQGRSIRGFSIEAGVGRSRLQNWIAGSSLPSVETAEYLAELLVAPRLVDLAREARSRTCDECGRAFHVEHASPARYCSPECKTTHAKVAAGARNLSRAVLERRARRYADAVALMCAGCEPAGLCRTPDCPLQLAGVSPFAISKDVIA